MQRLSQCQMKCAFISSLGGTAVVKTKNDKMGRLSRGGGKSTSLLMTPTGERRGKPGIGAHIKPSRGQKENGESTNGPWARKIGTSGSPNRNARFHKKLCFQIKQETTKVLTNGEGMMDPLNRRRLPGWKGRGSRDTDKS